MNSLSFKPIAPDFGAVVEGFDVDNVTASDKPLINKALDRFGVLVFPGLDLSESQQLGMAKLFGEPSKRSRPPSDRAERSPYADYMGLVTNVRKDGVPIGSLPDGEMWLHHDGCFIEEPYRATILYALEVTSVGGETRFVDMRAVFRSLSEDLIGRIRHLSGTHSFDYRNIAGRPVISASNKLAKCASHPSVIRHPNSAEPALYLNPLCTIGLESEGSDFSANEQLLEYLFSVIDQSTATFSHRWTRGDLVIWDNWSTCHARNDFPAGETRMLRRNIIKGQKLDAYFN